jgi:predicted peptidase
MNTNVLFSIALLSLAQPALTYAREWTATDGRKLEADFVSANQQAVTVKRTTDGRTFTLPLNGISETDQIWVREEVAKNVKPVEGPYASLLTGDWALSEDDGLPFALFGAKDLDASKKYPLVVSLHGRSPNTENGKQLGPFSRSFAEPARYAKNPCIIFAPHGYQPFGGQGTAWNSEPGTKALSLIEKLMKSLPIDENRIYVVGYSMGGFGACHLAVTEPKRFAAIVAGAGCTGIESADIFKRLPIWLHHAADDPTVEVKYSRDLAEALKRSKTMKYTEYPTGGHAIAGTIFNDDTVHDWIFQQHRE